MSKSLTEILSQNCLFTSKRVSILHWNYIESSSDFEHSRLPNVLEILTPNVTKALPDGWQNIDSIDKAEDWILQRKSDGDFYGLVLSDTTDIIGLLFLYPVKEAKDLVEIRLGYLLRGEVWGKGIGTELINGLVVWARNTKLVRSITGGVEKENLGLIRVLEKNGFYRSNEEMPEEMYFYKVKI